MAALLKILKKSEKYESKRAVQCYYLGELMRNVKEEREKEIAKAIKFTFNYLKLNYINAAFSFKKIMAHLRAKKQPSKK